MTYVFFFLSDQDLLKGFSVSPVKKERIEKTIFFGSANIEF